MCSTGDSEDVIIILSDDEDEDELGLSCSEPSVYIVEAEDVKKGDNCRLPPVVLDEDLVVTFSRRAEVLPHARYDCPIHPFTPTDCELNAPVADNQLMCDQCFCYICDKLASACVLWCHSGICHCNSHKRSEFWNNLRNGELLGGLKAFQLTLSEIDIHLRQAGARCPAEHEEQVCSAVTVVCRSLTVTQSCSLQSFCVLFQPFVCVPTHCSLCVRPWKDVLLVSVLKGQNVCGFRKEKGKKDILNELLSVVILRTELLQRQHRYRELCRYLLVVYISGSFQQVKDLIPFFMCKEGDLMSACNSFFPCLSPAVFLFYFRIFKTATAPKLIVTQPAELCHSDAPWEPIKGHVKIFTQNGSLWAITLFSVGATPLKRAELVKFALRVQRCSPGVFTDVGAQPASLLLLEIFVLSLKFHRIYSIHVVLNCLYFQEYPDQALLLLVTGALGLRILSGPLRPALPVLHTYQVFSLFLSICLWTLNLKS
uniref:Uncharacterized protein n=1 Tax=Echeneis naucrates TaxID=173247 RepID=A0A665TYD4_ECHNA